MSDSHLTTRVARRFIFLVFITLPGMKTIFPARAGGIWKSQLPASASFTKNEHAIATIGGYNLLLFGKYVGFFYAETLRDNLGNNFLTNQSPTTTPQDLFANHSYDERSRSCISVSSFF